MIVLDYQVFVFFGKILTDTIHKTDVKIFYYVLVWYEDCV